LVCACFRFVCSCLLLVARFNGSNLDNVDSSACIRLCLDTIRRLASPSKPASEHYEKLTYQSANQSISLYKTHLKQSSQKHHVSYNMKHFYYVLHRNGWIKTIESARIKVKKCTLNLWNDIIDHLSDNNKQRSSWNGITQGRCKRIYVYYFIFL